MILLPAVLLQGAAAQVQQLPAILESVSKNVKETRDSLPDFLCSEKVTSTTFESGRQRDQKIVESIYSIRQSREQREILTVDGKPAKKGAKMPGLPVNISPRRLHRKCSAGMTLSKRRKSREDLLFNSRQSQNNGK